MDVYEALYTTRARRRVRKDPIPEAVQAKILDAAIRAPTGGNAQGWRFMLVDDDAMKAKLGPLYRSALTQLFDTLYKPQTDAAAANPKAKESIAFKKMYRSAKHLADYFEDYPLLFFAFDQVDPTGSSIYPAIWNAMLAARAEGVGSALTSVLLFRLNEVLEVLEVPVDSGWRMACCVTLGYPTGHWGVAPRRPVHEVAYRNGWEQPLGMKIPKPLWP